MTTNLQQNLLELFTRNFRKLGIEKKKHSGITLWLLNTFFTKAILMCRCCKQITLNRLHSHGYSLVELIVVVTILGILGVIGSFAFKKIQWNAYLFECKTTLSQMVTAEQTFYSEWHQHFGDFRDNGYSPEGLMRFGCGYTEIMFQKAKAPTSSLWKGIVPSGSLARIGNNIDYCRDYPDRCSVDMDFISPFLEFNIRFDDSGCATQVCQANCWADFNKNSGVGYTSGGSIFLRSGKIVENISWTIPCRHEVQP